LHTGALAAIPAICRVTTRVAIFFDKGAGRVKMKKRNRDIE
jgi:hypothetical protein